MPDSVDALDIDEGTEELISLRIAQFRPDFIGSDGKTIVMLEYESSFLGKQTRKRFHAYVALYDYENNDEDLDIFFCVITTKEKSKIVKHKIGDIDSFKISVFNIADLGMEKILSNADFKIKNQIRFTTEELVELALTSLMPGSREKNIRQFFKLSNMMDKIVFDSEDAKTSFCGIVLLLSNIYFEKDDEMRKRIQGVFMGKVDCIVEMREDQFKNGFNNGFNNGFSDGVSKSSLKIARNMLAEGMSVEDVSKLTELPIDEVKKIEIE